jgi:hypothetical protein
MINIIDEITTFSAMSPAPKPTFSSVVIFCVCMIPTPSQTIRGAAE